MVELTYLCPSLLVEHRPSTTPRHHTLFWAALAIPDQLVPCCFSSASVSHFELLPGQPLFLFPCGFQVRAWHLVLDAGFLRVCPIQPHFFSSNCLATGSCPVRNCLKKYLKGQTNMHFTSDQFIVTCMIRVSCNGWDSYSWTKVNIDITDSIVSHL